MALIKPFITILLLLAFLNNCLAQLLINKTSSEIKGAIAKNNTAIYRFEYEENESVLKVLLRDERVQHTDYIYYFDENGKCDAEEHIFSCDSCMRKSLTTILRDVKYFWEQAGPQHYLSKYSKHLFLYVDTAKHSYILQRVEWKRKERRGMFFKNNSKPQDTVNAILWGTNALTWNDFKDTVNEHSYTTAWTNWQIWMMPKEKNINDTAYKIDILVYALFNPYKSGVVAVNSTTLPHEQLHFDITELCARQLRKKISETKFTSKNYLLLLNKLYDEAVKKCENLQHKFDSEVKTGAVAELSKWIANVQNQLIKLDLYK